MDATLSGPCNINFAALPCRDPKTGKQLPDELLLPEIATFFFAGEDTTSHTGAWTLCAHCHKIGKPDAKLNTKADVPNSC